MVAAEFPDAFEMQTGALGRDHQGFGLVEVARNQVARLILAKQNLCIGGIQGDPDASFLGQLERGKREATV